MALTKADQHPALAGDVLDPKPGATAIVPTPVFCVVIDRRQPPLGLDLANPPQIVGQCLMFDGTLLLVRGMLQRTAATSAIDRTPRFDAGTRWFKNLQEFCLIEVTPPLAALKAYCLARQRAGDEDFFARKRGNSPAIVGSRLDPSRFRFALTACHSSAGQASANSFRCGWSSEAMVLRTSSYSRGRELSSRWPRIYSNRR